MSSPDSPRDPVWDEVQTLMSHYFSFVQKFLPERNILKKIFLEIFN
jgi:hypothetical protein